MDFPALGQKLFQSARVGADVPVQHNQLVLWVGGGSSFNRLLYIESRGGEEPHPPSVAVGFCSDQQGAGHLFQF